MWKLQQVSHPVHQILIDSFIAICKHFPHMIVDGTVVHMLVRGTYFCIHHVFWNKQIQLLFGWSLWMIGWARFEDNIVVLALGWMPFKSSLLTSPRVYPSFQNKEKGQEVWLGCWFVTQNSLLEKEIWAKNLFAYFTRASLAASASLCWLNLSLAVNDSKDSSAVRSSPVPIRAILAAALSLILLGLLQMCWSDGGSDNQQWTMMINNPNDEQWWTTKTLAILTKNK